MAVLFGILNNFICFLLASSLPAHGEPEFGCWMDRKVFAVVFASCLGLSCCIPSSRDCLPQGQIALSSASSQQGHGSNIGWIQEDLCDICCGQKYAMRLCG